MDFGVSFALLPLLMIIVGWLVTFLLGLLFVVLAARFATRAVLDEIRRDRASKGGP
jgi:hypothetical protein